MTPTTTTTRPPATTTTTRPATTTTRPPATTTTTRPATTTTVPAGAKPSAPQNARVTSTTGGITICWSPPASGAPILSYKVYRGGWGSETYFATVSGSTTCYTDASAPMWTWFYYRVTAVNGAGEGPPSADVGANRSA